EVEGKSWTVSVTVLPVPAATVTIEGPSDPLAPGLTATLKAVVKDAKGLPLSGREVQWSSSTPKVAAVTGQGVVTAHAPGSAVITATVEGKKAEHRVTVPAPAPVVEAKTEVVPPPAAPAPRRAPEVKTEVVAARPAPAPRAAPAPKQDHAPVVTVPTSAPVGTASGKGKLIGVVAGVAVLAALGYF